MDLIHQATKVLASVLPTTGPSQEDIPRVPYEQVSTLNHDQKLEWIFHTLRKYEEHHGKFGMDEQLLALRRNSWSADPSLSAWMETTYTDQECALKSALCQDRFKESAESGIRSKAVRIIQEYNILARANSEPISVNKTDADKNSDDCISSLNNVVKDNKNPNSTSKEMRRSKSWIDTSCLYNSSNLETLEKPEVLKEEGDETNAENTASSMTKEAAGVVANFNGTPKYSINERGISVDFDADYLPKQPFSDITGSTRKHSLIEVGTARRSSRTPFDEECTRSIDVLTNSFLDRMKRNESLQDLHGEKCRSLLKQTDTWDLDVFQLTSASGNRPLSLVAMKVIHDRELITILGLDEKKLLNFFTEVESNYGLFPDIPYHNNIHACDVMHSVHFMLDSPAVAHAFSDLEKFAALLAAAIHDLSHPGKTNAFLIKTKDPLAILYNDSSVLENHHVAKAFSMMRKPEFNILSDLDPRDQLIVRKLVIDMVMSTDMVKHAKFLGEFRDLQTRINEQIEDPDNEINSVQDQLKESYDDRALVLCTIVHSADLGSPAKPWDLCKEWTERLMQEFFAEGDEEKKMNLPIGMLNDRSTVDIPKAQVGFITYIALPLWEAWSSFVEPNSLTLQVANCKNNLAEWTRIVDEEPAPKRKQSSDV